MSAIDRARALLNLAPLRVDLAAIEAWNAANERARDEYRTHPMASSCGSSCRCSWRMGKQARQKAQEAAGRAARGQVAPEDVRAAKGAQIGAQQLPEGTDG